MQSALAGVTAASAAFERSAEQVSRFASAPSRAEAAETVRISPEARAAAAESTDSALTSGIEGALVDTRVAKYAFIANLKVLQTGAELEKTVANMLKSKS